MKKLLSLAFLSILFVNSYAQCTLSIIGDSVVCKGEHQTLIADVIGPKISLDACTASGNNHRGNMFNIIATNDVRIISFDVSPMGNTTVEVYFKSGSWIGYENNPSAWTFIGAAPVTYTGGFSTLDLPINVHIPSGETYAFYVTSNNTSVSLNYSNGSVVGNTYSSDANIAFIEGSGLDYPFTQGTGAVYQPRVWNGRINYALDSVPLTFLWNTLETSNSIDTSITTPSQFTVESTIAGCHTLFDTLNISLSIPTQDICLGDSVLLFGSGATSYSWNNGVTDSVRFLPSFSGTTSYTIVGTDSFGCTDSDTVDIIVHELPNVDAGIDQNICTGSETTLSATGATNYFWNNGLENNTSFTPLLSSEYVVTGTDVFGCLNIDTIYISLLPLPTAVVSRLGNILISDSASSYQWIDCSTNLPIPGENNQLFIASENGNYAVIIQNHSGCSDTSSCFTISNVGINSSEQNDWIISPNPSNGIFTIATSQSNTNALVEIFSSIGQIVYQTTLSGMILNVNIENEPNGVYFVRINNEQNIRLVKF